jgi:hypothetical protein
MKKIIILFGMRDRLQNGAKRPEKSGLMKFDFYTIFMYNIYREGKNPSTHYA